MPHATTFQFTAKPGKRDEVLALFKRWDEERSSTTNGFMRGMVSSRVDNPDDFLAGVMFDSTDHYKANSAAEETNDWFGELRALLVDDPVWFDGNVEIQMRPSA